MNCEQPQLHLTIVTLSWTFNETTQTYETWCCLASNFSLSWHFLSHVLKRHCSTISISNFHGKSWRYFFFFSSSPWLLFFVSVISLKHGIGWNLWNFILEYVKVWLEIFCIKHRILKVSKFLSNNACFFVWAIPIKAQNKSLALVIRLEPLRSFTDYNFLDKKSYITLLVFVYRFVCLITDCCCKVRKLLEYVVEWDYEEVVGEVELILNTKMLSKNTKKESFSTSLCLTWTWVYYVSIWRVKY